MHACSGGAPQAVRGRPSVYASAVGPAAPAYRARLGLGPARDGRGRPEAGCRRRRGRAVHPESAHRCRRAGRRSELGPGRGDRTVWSSPTATGSSPGRGPGARTGEKDVPCVGPAGGAREIAVDRGGWSALPGRHPLRAARAGDLRRGLRPGPTTSSSRSRMTRCSSCSDDRSPVGERSPASGFWSRRCLAAALVPLNSTMLAVALPDIAREFHPTPVIVAQRSSRAIWSPRSRCRAPAASSATGSATGGFCRSATPRSDGCAPRDPRAVPRLAGGWPGC